MKGLKEFPNVHEYFYRKQVHNWKENLEKSLQELLSAEEQNYDTAKAMLTPNRELDKGDLLSRSWGRITLLRELLGIENNPKEEGNK